MDLKESYKAMLKGPIWDMQKIILKLNWWGCWAHARRRFFEAQKEYPKAVSLVLRIIGWIYETEALSDSHKLSAERWAYHRKKFYPRKLYWLKKVAIGLRSKVLPKSGLGKAYDYLIIYWEPLVAHIELGENRINNNLIENAIGHLRLAKRIGFLSVTPMLAKYLPLYTRCGILSVKRYRSPGMHA